MTHSTSSGQAATLDQAAFVEALRTVNAAVQSRNTIPILSNVLLRVDGETATLMGTDLDVQIVAAIGGASGALETTLPAEKALAAATSFRPGAIDIAVDGGKAVFKQGRSQRTLLVLPAQDFPLFVPPEGAVSFTLPAAALSRLIDPTHVAMDDGKARPILAGVHLRRDGKVLRGAALNGHFMIRSDVPAPAGSDDMPEITISAKTVGLLRKLLAKGGEARVTASATKIHVELAGSQLLAKLLDDAYPDVQRMIPEGGTHKLSAQRDVMTSAAAAAMAVVEADSKSIRAIKITLEPDAEPEFSARDTMGGSSVEPLDGGYEGDGLMIGINGRYLQQIAGVFAESSSVDLTMIDAQKAIVFTAANEPDLLAICMPLRV